MTTRTPAQYDWAHALFNDRRITKHFTSPRRLAITHVTLHHMDSRSSGTDASNTAVLEGCYKTWMGTREPRLTTASPAIKCGSSFGQRRGVVGCHSTSNHSTLSIEHADSTLAPDYTISSQTMATGQRLVANLTCSTSWAGPRAKLSTFIGITTLRRAQVHT